MHRATTPTRWPAEGRFDAAERQLRRIVWLAFLVASAALWWPVEASAARVREVASVAGVRSNQLTGYGLVVGLDGSGDQTTAAPFTCLLYTSPSPRD
jgi:flagellar P-ring protein precursor FlgI